MERVNASQAREDFAELLNRVAYAGERVVLHRRGKNVAALVSMEDLEMLEALEEQEDNRAADAALAEGGQPVPWEQVKDRSTNRPFKLKNLLRSVTPTNRHPEAL